MEVLNQATPEWLVPWLQLPFYKEKCKKHEKQYTVVYCGVCKGRPVCDICWKVKYSKEHQGHHHLQVCSSSRRAAIDIEEISKFFDASGIQNYAINKKKIVYLNPHREGNPNPNHKPNCEICMKRLVDSHYRFCSIACKYTSKGYGGSRQIEKKSQHPEKQPALWMKNKSMECDIKIKKKTKPEKQQPLLKRKMTNSECCSLRKRSRKGFPQKAPFI